MNRKYLSPSEAGEYIGVSVKTIYRWLNAGILTRYQIGGTIRIKVEEIENALSEPADL